MDVGLVLIQAGYKKRATVVDVTGVGTRNSHSTPDRLTVWCGGVSSFFPWRRRSQVKTMAESTITVSSHGAGTVLRHQFISRALRSFTAPGAAPQLHATPTRAVYSNMFICLFVLGPVFIRCWMVLAIQLL